ncbi:MAG: HMA2 domain-containing protein [Nitrospirota bacterium]
MPPKKAAAVAVALPKAHVGHTSKGRIRFKVPSKKGDARFFVSVKEKLEKSDKVATIEVNPVTGSILVTHNTDDDSIIKLAEAGKTFKVDIINKPGRPKHPPVSRDMLHGFKGLDEKLKSATGGELDLPSVAFLTLLGIGIYQIIKGNFAAPAWYTAFWYALNIFLKAQPDGLENAVV